MVAGIDRYMQIARCYRDEDLRGDRQPEFTQLDLEMSFVDEAAVMAFVEAMAIEVSRATVPDRPILETPFPRMTYEEALERFGSDKPDVRFGMELVDLGSVLVGPDGTPSSGFGVFDNALAAGGRVKAIVAPGMAGITRREIDELTERARRFGAKGLAYLALEAGGEIKSPIAKFLSDETQRALIEETGAGEGDLILIVADTPRSPRTSSVASGSGSASGSAWPTRTCSRTSGSIASRCTSGTRSSAAGTPRTTRSAASCPRTRRSS